MEEGGKLPPDLFQNRWFYSYLLTSSVSRSSYPHSTSLPPRPLTAPLYLLARPQLSKRMAPRVLRILRFEFRVSGFPEIRMAQAQVL